jgi:hypothetical protein
MSASENAKTNSTASHSGSEGVGLSLGDPLRGFESAGKKGNEQLTFKTQYYTIKATRERRDRGFCLGSVGEFARVGLEGVSGGGGGLRGL